MSRLAPIAKAALAAGCGYEIVALYSPLPTITSMMHVLKRRPVTRVAVWAIAGGVVWHFFVDGGQFDPQPAMSRTMLR